MIQRLARSRWGVGLDELAGDLECHKRTVYRDLDALMVSATRVTDAVERGKGSLGRLVNDPRVYNELVASTAALNAITAKVARGEGSLGVLLNDPALAASGV